MLFRGLDSLYVNCIQAFFAFSYFERYSVIFTDLVNQARLMNKDILVCVISNDEAESFRFVEKFNFTCFHKMVNK